jgi:hypothetical protein
MRRWNGVGAQGHSQDPREMPIKRNRCQTRSVVSRGRCVSDLARKNLERRRCGNDDNPNSPAFEKSLFGNSGVSLISAPGGQRGSVDRRWVIYWPSPVSVLPLLLSFR